MKKFFACLALVFIVALSLSADVYIKTKSHTGGSGMMGLAKPAQDGFSEQWIGADKFALVSGEQTIVVDLTKNLGYIISHKTKSYSEMPLPLDLSKLFPSQAASMTGSMKLTASVVPTNETKKIGQWNCKGYNMTVSMMGLGMTSKVWATSDVPFNVNDYNSKFLAYTLKGLGPMVDDAMIKEMMKIDGFQIATEMDMFGSKVTSEVVEITQKNAPANVYAPPPGYTKKAR